MEEHLHILWTNADPVVFDKMVLMYAVNSLTHGWWEKVTVILWGESARLAVEDPAVARAHPPGPGAGRGVLCLRFLRRELGVEEQLREMGLEVIPWGEPLTRLIRSRAPLLTV